MQKGFTLLIAIVITGTIALIAAGVINLALKQNTISSLGNYSQQAFYAADTGIDCALYWDVGNPSGASAFAVTSPASDISCNGTVSTVGGGASVNTFDINFSPDPFCATVRVTKLNNGSTTIESFGYNTCDPSSPRRVERAIEAEY